MLKNTNIDSELPLYVKEFSVLADKVTVPAQQTTYWCHVKKLDDEFQKKHHVYEVTLLILLINKYFVF